jgi:pimeloyl-ACP methyl ester carboxylesterase
LHGIEDTVNHPKTSDGKESFFSNYYERKLLPKIGHFPQREDPQLIANALIGFLNRAV